MCLQGNKNLERLPQMKKSDGSVVPTRFSSSLFTLYALQIENRNQRHWSLLEAPCHFRSLESATCLIADKTVGAVFNLF